MSQGRGGIRLGGESLGMAIPRILVFWARNSPRGVGIAAATVRPVPAPLVPIRDVARASEAVKKLTFHFSPVCFQLVTGEKIGIFQLIHSPS
jgi:hypothetical protein